MGDAPVEVQRECEVALAAVTRAVPSSAVVSGSVAEWAGAIGALQRVIDVASAAQDAAMARLAAIETEVAEDGRVSSVSRSGRACSSPIPTPGRTDR